MLEHKTFCVAQSFYFLVIILLRFIFLSIQFAYNFVRSSQTKLLRRNSKWFTIVFHTYTLLTYLLNMIMFVQKINLCFDSKNRSTKLKLIQCRARMKTDQHKRISFLFLYFKLKFLWICMPWKTITTILYEIHVASLD